jgi:hypothetical protein
MPDLSPLMESDPDLCARIVLAMLGGARWEQVHAGGWWHLTIGTRGDCGTLDRRHFVPDFALPDPLNDDGDAWRLMMRERIDIKHDEDTGDVMALSWDEAAPGFGCIHEVRHAGSRRAVRDAALHKRKDGHLSHIIRPLLEQLERA